MYYYYSFLRQFSFHFVQQRKLSSTNNLEKKIYCEKVRAYICVYNKQKTYVLEKHFKTFCN